MCVPCAYKLGRFDPSFDPEFCKLVPNQRPEACPRIQKIRVCQNGTLGYGNPEARQVLICGDGDLSFSLSLAKVLKHDEHKEETRLIATSYDSKETLLQVYPGTAERIQELMDLGVEVRYEIDATKIHEYFPNGEIFDRIIWNFPCTSISDGQDGQNAEMEHNKSLVREFTHSAASLLHEQHGEIHMTHKTKPPFDQWKIEQVALEKDPQGVTYLGRVVFDRALFPPYVPRKALHKKSFPCHDACIYIFGKGCSMKNVLPMEDLDDVMVTDACTLRAVTPELIQAVRQRILLAQKPMLPDKKKKKKGKR